MCPRLEGHTGSVPWQHCFSLSIFTPFVVRLAISLPIYILHTEPRVVPDSPHHQQRRLACLRSRGVSLDDPDDPSHVREPMSH